MVVLLGLTLHPQQPSQKDGDLAAGSKSIILLWQYMAGRFNAGHLIWILDQTFALVDISFQGMWFHIKHLAFRKGVWI